MSIDFTLTPAQRELQLSARKFARSVLADVAPATRNLADAAERFAATRPFYEQVVKAGFLRRLIPLPLGGEGTGVVDMAVVAEEFQSVDVNVSLTMFGAILGLTPVMIAGTPDQQKQFLAPFLTGKGTPLAAFAFSEPGGSANFASPPPGAGVRTSARLDGDSWVIDGAKQWVSSATGWNGDGADLICVVCRTDPAAPPESAISVIAVPGPVRGISIERLSDSMGHRVDLTPRFSLDEALTPRDHVLEAVGCGERTGRSELRRYRGDRRRVRGCPDAGGVRVRARLRQHAASRRSRCRSSSTRRSAMRLPTPRRRSKPRAPSAGVPATRSTCSRRARWSFHCRPRSSAWETCRSRHR